MTRYWRRYGFPLAIASSVLVGGAIAISEDCVLAQITPDGTLPNNSIVTPQGNTSVISGGTQAGSNLFHSFEQFSVPTGGAAHFNNDLNIQNIFSRVTGESISNIDGLIRANGTANLFLLNPNGIIFGPNASLNIGGSFVGSTASAVNFADGTHFSAAAPQATPLLTVSVPLGLQFGLQAGSIRNQSQVNIQAVFPYYDSFGNLASLSYENRAGLNVQPGRTLALVGNGVALEGGYMTVGDPSNPSFPYDSIEGRIELGSVASPSLVRLTSTEQGWVLGYEGVQNFQDIQLSQAAYVLGGDIQVRGKQVRLDDSEILSNTNIVVTASELVSVRGDSFSTRLSTDTSGLGDAGDLTITTGELIVQDGAEVSGERNLAVTASESVQVIGTDAYGFGSRLSADTEGIGPGGDLTIETRQLNVQDGAQILTDNTSYAGDAGDLTIRASDSVKVSGGGSILSLTTEDSTGAGGNLVIETSRLEGTQLGVRNLGQGPVGTLTIITTEPLPNVGAQIIPDETLPINSTVRSDFNTNTIEGGTQVGSNLFHSFAQFSLPTLSTAYFNNALDVQNIIARITGSSVSNIDGLIKANGTANLFLLNPNGFIFGRSAFLNIGGSFLGSTATSLNFADGIQFSAQATQTTPSLTMNVPTGLQFGSSEGSILSQSRWVGSDSGLFFRVLSGRTLALVGGDVSLDGGTLQALGGRVELGGVTEAGTVGLNVDGNNLSLSFPDGVALADVSLNGASLEVQGRGGEINIQAGSISLTDYSRIETIDYGGVAANISLRADDSVSLRGGSIYSFAGFGESTGTVNIQGRSISLDESEVRIESGQGLSGDINMHASDAITISGSSLNASGGYYNSPGISRSISAGGNINIRARALTLSDGAYLESTLNGNGVAGNVFVQVDDSVSLTNSSISTQTSTLAQGNGGDISIKTGSLSLAEGAQLSASGQGNGAAGSINVEASSIRLDNQATLSSNTTAGQGNIFLRSRDLVLRRGSNITTDATGTSTGGNINIDTGVIAALENSDITANAQDARGGQVTIDAQGIFRTQDSDITATSNLGPQFSGTVEINTPDVDPNRGLINLPAELVDASRLIASSCGAGGENKFTITGRGGIPPSPNEVLSSDAVWVDWGTLNPKAENSSSPPVSTNPTATEPAPIVEARGWVINDKGEVVLTATAPNVTPHSPWISSATCRTPQTSS